MHFIKYRKTSILEAMEFQYTWLTYVKVCEIFGIKPELDNFHKTKEEGFTFENPSGTLTLRIGDYLAFGGPGDYYVITKEFMEKNYEPLVPKPVSY